MLRSSNKAGCLSRIERADKFHHARTPGTTDPRHSLTRGGRSAPPTPANEIRAYEVQWDWLHQLNLSCAQRHDDNWGQKLGGATVPQAHPIGYPLYRLEWQSLGSLRRRLRNCLIGMRAEPYPNESPAIVDLELYLAWRARGLVIETPAVRP